MFRSKKVFFHTDAAQAVGKLPISVDDMKIDLMSISGHKIYGPKVAITLWLFLIYKTEYNISYMTIYYHIDFQNRNINKQIIRNQCRYL